MFPEQIAFLNAITAQPDDDLPRLVYADWLDENGQSPRAEFIRLQIARFRAGQTSFSPGEYDLLRQYEPEWRNELPPLLQAGASFRRGFYYHLRCSIRSLIESTRKYVVREPIEVLHVTVDSLDPEWLAYHPPPLTLPLSEISISCPFSVGPILLTALTRYGPFPRVRTLTIRDRNLGDDAFEFLQPEITCPQLEELDLTQCGITDRGAEELATSDQFAGLKRLVLRGNTISHGHLAWLRHRFGTGLVV